MYWLQKSHKILKSGGNANDQHEKRIAATLTVATLTIGLTIPATAADMFGESIRVSSYKGTTLKVGERSGLIIGPSGMDYTVTSSDPDTVTVEQVLTFWVAIAKAEGRAEITASNSTGECGTVMLTVGAAATPAPLVEDDNARLTDNLEIRQEMIQLINQTRKANGVPVLPVNEALMNAAQACSNRRYTWHHSPEESQAAVDSGYPYGSGPTSPCSPAQPTPPSALSTIGSTLPVTSRPWSTRDATASVWA